MYQLIATKHFKRSSSGFCKKNTKLKQRLIKTLSILSLDPFNKTLKSHKVNSRIYGKKYSSRVSSNIRIIWDFSKNNKIEIYLLDMGGHFGKKSVY